MKYVLDVAKWKCGGSSCLPDLVEGCHLGEGATYMLNEQGYMCCLGQFAIQAGMTEKDLKNRMDPVDVTRWHSDGNYDPAFIITREGAAGTPYFINGTLALRLIDINDDRTTPIKAKIEFLRDALEDAGHELEIINGEQYEA